MKLWTLMDTYETWRFIGLVETSVVEVDNEM